MPAWQVRKPANSGNESIADAEADVVVAVVRVVVVPIGNPAVVGIVVPVTAPFHTVRPALLSLPDSVANPFNQLM